MAALRQNACDTIAKIVDGLDLGDDEDNHADDDAEHLDRGSTSSSGKTVYLRATPPYSAMSKHLGMLEEMTQACDIDRVCEGLRKALIPFVTAHAVRTHMQTDLREFVTL